jgi:alpha-glucosidase (family GH31 glycosyl hydrolase)
VDLPEGGWADVLTGERVDGGSATMTALLRRFPVAILGREP